TPCLPPSTLFPYTTLFRSRRQLVHIVDDEDLEAVADRKDRESGDDDVAHVVDARVRGGVDLQDVDVAAFRNLGAGLAAPAGIGRSEEHTSELQSRFDLVCR